MFKRLTVQRRVNRALRAYVTGYLQGMGALERAEQHRQAVSYGR